MLGCAFLKVFCFHLKGMKCQALKISKGWGRLEDVFEALLISYHACLVPLGVPPSPPLLADTPPCLGRVWCHQLTWSSRTVVPFGGGLRTCRCARTQDLAGFPPQRAWMRTDLRDLWLEADVPLHPPAVVMASAPPGLSCPPIHGRTVPAPHWSTGWVSLVIKSRLLSLIHI